MTVRRCLLLLSVFAGLLPLTGVSFAQSAQEPLKFPVGALVIRKLKTVATVYPEDARKKQVQGTVSFRAVIGRNGTVEHLTAINGPPELLHAAEDAVKKWTYEPYVKDGEPKAIQTVLQINFSLGERDPGPAWTQEYRHVPPVEMAAHLRTMFDPTRSSKVDSKGLVGLLIIVDANGNVEQAEAALGPPQLAEIARTAVLQWKYTPYMIQGRPAAVITHVLFDFE